MGDAPRQGAKAFHAICLMQLHGQHLLFSNVFDNTGDTNDPAAVIMYGNSPVRNPAHIAIRKHNSIFPGFATPGFCDSDK